MKRSLRSHPGLAIVRLCHLCVAIIGTRDWTRQLYVVLQRNKELFEELLGLFPVVDFSPGMTDSMDRQNLPNERLNRSRAPRGFPRRWL